MVDREADGNFGRFKYRAGDVVVSDIPSREAPEGRRSLDDEVKSVHFDAIKVFFLWNRCLSWLMLVTT